jgi:hypothetical protein
VSTKPQISLSYARGWQRCHTTAIVLNHCGFWPILSGRAFIFSNQTLKPLQAGCENDSFRNETIKGSLTKEKTLHNFVALSF